MKILGKLIRYGAVLKIMVSTVVIGTPMVGFADTLGPPPLAATKATFNMVARACNIPHSLGKTDVVFERHPEIFYRSNSECLSLSGEKYCATYIVRAAGGGTCLGYLYTTASPLFGSSKGSELGKHYETLIFNTPTGDVAVKSGVDGIEVQRHRARLFK